MEYSRIIPNPQIQYPMLCFACTIVSWTFTSPFICYSEFKMGWGPLFLMCLSFVVCVCFCFFWYSLQTASSCHWLYLCIAFPPLLLNIIPYIGRFSLLKDFTVVSNCENYTHNFFQQRNTITIFLIQEVRCHPQYYPGQLLQQIEKWKKPSVPHLVWNMGHVRLQSWCNCSSSCLLDFIINVAAMNVLVSSILHHVFFTS